MHPIKRRWRERRMGRRYRRAAEVRHARRRSLPLAKVLAIADVRPDVPTQEIGSFEPIENANFRARRMTWLMRIRNEIDPNYIEEV